MASRSIARSSRSLTHLSRNLQDTKHGVFESQIDAFQKPITQRPCFPQRITKSLSRPYTSSPSNPTTPKPLQDPTPLPKTPLAARSKVAGLRSTETYVAYGITKRLFEACSNQANYKIPQISQKGASIPKTPNGEDLGVGEGWWYSDIGLLPTFSSWSQVTFLHMYLLSVRLRGLPSPESYHTFSRYLFDHFSNAAEDRMDVMHGITSRGIRVKYLKDLFLQWRGAIVAYDEGLIKGDAVLAAAVWRNLYKGSYTDARGNGGPMDWTQIAQVVLYMRKVLGQLAAMDETAMALGVGGQEGVFRMNQSNNGLIEVPSKGLEEPISDH